MSNGDSLSTSQRPRIWTDIHLLPEAAALLKTYADIATDSDPEALPGSVAAIISSLVNANGAWMDRAGSTLLAIARPGIGVDNIDIAAATARGILVINTPDGPTESTAEHAVALLLALAKQVVAADRRLREEGWSAARLRGVEVRGKTLGIVGLGRIGRRVAQICRQGLGMRVVAYDPLAPVDAFTALDIVRAETLDNLLIQSQVLTLHCALTPETQGLIGARELALLPQGAWLINVSRGAVVDQEALIDALTTGRLAGAGLDVFNPEPLPDNHPLLRLPNVILTPHIASFTDDGVRAMHYGAAEQIVCLLRGEQPLHIVNPEALPGRLSRMNATQTIADP
ncbi:MAG: hydroxyacid dehydrogenase [Roseiflexus sp.]|nr:hydroxyacid dehydrogenase [Roseiflexus sp.]MCS7287734.1 hydroxyacid dehydrogenase [Roseiflexus sp.]MDW8147933.1 hydroxyacid dehydrogenase [Roseiflexaceae bacterium]MDW8231968.1 hydroxyacid dehydrogenase [Roseiflexaceae bacterium]